MNRTVYIGIIKNDQYDVKTLVVAENSEDAKQKVLEKFKSDFGTYFHEDDVSVRLFADGQK